MINLDLLSIPPMSYISQYDDVSLFFFSSDSLGIIFLYFGRNILIFSVKLFYKYEYKVYNNS